MFKVTHFDARVLSWWNTQRKKIDMAPNYQRKGRLWSLTDKQLLIDSILNEFDIPKVYVADFTFGNSKLNKAKLPFAIIDGKQRFEAIFEFFAGELVLADDFIFLDDSKLKLASLGYRDLKTGHPEIADRFDNFHLTVMRVLSDDEDQIRELFVRLNRSKPLTGAEIRNAMPGPVSEVIRDLGNHEFFASIVRFTTTRAQDQNAAAKLLLFEYRDEPTDTKKTHLDSFAKDISKAKNRRELSAAATRVMGNLDEMVSIFLPKDKLLTSAGIIPVYYWFIRNVPAKKHHLIREFLVGVNKELKGEESAKILKKDEIVRFNELSRSTNDQGSLVGRYELLKEAFART